MGALEFAEAVLPGRAEPAPECGNEGVSDSGNATDRAIIAELERLSGEDGDYWAFRGRAGRKQTQGLIQYPAMMVPEMQAVLVKAVTAAEQRVEMVYDPFAGSGTTLVESMRLGLDFVGQDINPLAVLICRTKSGPFHLHKLACVIEEVLTRAGADRGRRYEASFPGLRKWFCPRAITELSRIRRAICRVDHPWCRRVLWTALAETVRQTSNSRTSTFKLHIRDAKDLEGRVVRPLETFSAVVSDMRERLAEEAATLREGGHLTKGGYYRGRIEVRLGDSIEPDGEALAADLIVTSPPYGDNTSTVPYGQFSYLPLQWIELADIGADVDRGCIESAYEIDGRSLGGSRRNAVEQVCELLNVSPSLKSTLRRLKGLPPDRKSRVAAFVRDLDASLGAVLARLRAEGYMIWTIGNRRVGGEPVPSDRILGELLAARGVREVARVDRVIPKKRMANRNSIASTMCGETILVFRKR